MDPRILEAVPAAIYMVDGAGRITFYNEAAARLWGHRPRIGGSEWGGAWRIFWPDGTKMRHDECPMAVALKDGAPKAGESGVGAEVILERPDGTHIAVMAYPGVLKDTSGRVTGGINVVVDIGDRKQAEMDAGWLAAIVSSSEDAIISKTLDGTITSWNAGAARIFGYSAEEMLGDSVKRIVPPELWSEEDEILAKLRRGERIEHFDTTRLAKDGRRMAISLTISPIMNRAGSIIGASKVARDISARKEHEEMQQLLLEELNHRVKNTLATIQSIATQSMRQSASPAEFVAGFNGRVQALGRAHDLLVQSKMQGATLPEILREQVVLGSGETDRVTCSGPDISFGSRLAIQLALVLHELATNARKHGALAAPAGRLAISWDVELGAEPELRLVWKESGVTGVETPRSRGFGTSLIERTLASNDGNALIRYEGDGLRCEIRLPVPETGGRRAGPTSPLASGRPSPARNAADESILKGKRVLIVEDEPLVAMDMEGELLALGLEVVGPVSTVARAEKAVAETALDAALLDANLHGKPVERVAEALARKGVPFAFATGYGRETLPKAFEAAPVLAKPFDSHRLGAVLLDLLAPRHEGEAPEVVQLRPRGR